jgi:hypothetical protein
MRKVVLDVRLLILVTALPVLSACYSQHQITPKALSTMLAPGMTQDQVRGIAGPPASTSMNTCGGQYGPTWPCLVWHYDAELGLYGTLEMLDLWFEEKQGQWIVNSWNYIGL